MENARKLRRAAEQGHAYAQFNLGALYELGEGVPKNEAEAVRWYRKAAEQEHAEARYHLARMYAIGKGVKENDAEAMKWLRMSAEQGYSQAQLNLGYRHCIGKGVSKDATEAAVWTRRAAEQGHMEAQYGLGMMYDDGEGVPKDAAEAAKWTFKAAERGHADAQYVLGTMYEAGKGVPQRAAEAMRWYRKAARQGQAEAQSVLGITDTDENGSTDEAEKNEPSDPFQAPESEWISQETDMFLSALVHRRQSVDSRLADEDIGKWMLWEFLETPEAMILDVTTKWHLLRTAHVAEPDIWKKFESQRDKEARRHDGRDAPLPTPIDLDAYIENRLSMEDPAFLTLGSRFIKEQINFCRRYAEHQSEHGWQPPREWLVEKISVQEFDSGSFGAKLSELPDDATVVFDGTTARYFLGLQALQPKLRDLRFLMLPGDEFWTFYSPHKYWQNLCGRGGVALVRDGIPVGHVVLVMN